MTAPAGGSSPRGAGGPPEAEIRTEWAVRFTAKASGYTFLADHAIIGEAAARREAEQPSRVTPPGAWAGKVVSRTVMISPWQLSPGEATTETQLAGLLASAAETLHRLSAAFSPEEAAAVAVKLQAALDHITGTLRTTADVLPYASRHLDVAAARTDVTAHMIGSTNQASAADRDAVTAPSAVREQDQSIASRPPTGLGFTGPAGRTSAPKLAGNSFPALVHTGPPAAPSGPVPSQARQRPSDQAPGRRR
jgi:hypothetical protein